MVIAAALIAITLGSAVLAALSKHLARLDEARDILPPSFIFSGDEP